MYEKLFESIKEKLQNKIIRHISFPHSLESRLYNTMELYQTSEGAPVTTQNTKVLQNTKAQFTTYCIYTYYIIDVKIVTSKHFCKNGGTIFCFH